MSWSVRHKSAAYRVRDSERVTVENFGPLHRGSPMLEWGSVTKTVTARIARRGHEPVAHLRAAGSSASDDWTSGVQPHT